MNRDRYLFLLQWAEEKPLRKKIICGLTSFIPIFLGITYVITIIYVFFFYPMKLSRLILRPLICFITVTMMRNIIKAPRPYDLLDFKPLCGYHPGKNKSFPSRHTASAVIIALELMRIWSGWFGVFCAALAVVMGICRILCGNHFIKDVIGALIISFLFNCL